MNKSTILVVDDDPQLRDVLVRILAGLGHIVQTASDGREALLCIAEQRPDLVVTDIDMPLVDGFELCKRIKENATTRLIPVLMITGRDGFDDRMQAWELGADDFLTKPFQAIEVRVRCRSLLRIKNLIDELDSAETVAFAFARAVEAKCRYTWGHSERVTGYALALALRVGLPESEREVLAKGGMLHDIGKIHIPDAILNKPGKLTPEEYAVIKEHPVQGVRIVEPLRSIRATIPVIRSHHERMDGRGYPDGLFGGAIPFLARILAVADVYDALSSARPYRPALPHDRCLHILHEDADQGGLDPELVRCFCDAHTGTAQIFGKVAWVEHSDSARVG